MSSSIPMIDISSIVHSGEPSQTLIAEWDAAMRSVGCAILVGHRVDPAFGNELYMKAQEFFRRPAAEKLKYKNGQSFGTGGYTPSGVEASSGTGQADQLESYIHRLDLPDRNECLPPELKSTVDAYCQAMANLLAIIHRLSAKTLGLPDAFFDQHYTEPMNTLKLSNYLPLAQAKDMNGHEEESADVKRLLYGAHKDLLGFTLLRQDSAIPGLEIWLDEPKQWMTVPHTIDNSFVVNAGNIIELWTNGLWKSPQHRVAYYPQSPMSPQTHLCRLSVIFFTGPNAETQVAPLASCVEMTGGKPLYDSFTAHEYLMAKLETAQIKQSE